MKKSCTKCSVIKFLSEFSKDKYTKDGFTHQCKMCRRLNTKKWANKNLEKIQTYRQNNRAKHTADMRAYRAKNPEYERRYRTSEKGKAQARKQRKRYYYAHKAQENQKFKDYYQKNHSRELTRRRQYYQKNREIEIAKFLKWAKENPVNRRFHAAKRRASLKQATPQWIDLKAIEEFYKNCPSSCEIDHIIPLTHPDVQGLHVPWNLQYLPISENRRKSNHFISNPINS